MARRTVGRTLEMGVAEATLAAARDHRALSHVGEVGEQDLAVLLVDLRAGRHLQHDIGAARAVAVLAHPAAAVLRLEMLLVAVIDERVEPVDRLYDHVAAVAAVAGADIHLGFIEELHDARYAITGAKYESARGRSPRAALKKFGQKLAGREVSVGRGQGGPCLTDAAQ